jgi:hypothetical protein
MGRVQVAEVGLISDQGKYGEGRRRRAQWYGLQLPAILCIEHFYGYVTSWVGNIMEENFCMFNEITGMVIFVSIMCCK